MKKNNISKKEMRVHGKKRGFFSRKGQTRPIYLLLFVAFAVVVLIVSLIAKFLLTIRFTDPRSALNFEVVTLAKNPYSLAHVLMVLKPDIRTVTEIALQTVVTENISVDDIGRLDATIRPYLDRLPIEYYNVKIVKGNQTFYNLDKGGRRCGANDEGYCSYTQLFPNSRQPTPATPCGIGRRDIDDAGKCPFWGARYCCAEDYVPGTDVYNPPSGNWQVVRCGANSIGICDYSCREGRVEIPETNDECPSEGGSILGIGRIDLRCCAPVDKVGFAEIGTLVSAEVPLLYKTKQAEQTFYCVDQPSQCPAEIARGLCNDIAKQCCITEPISCRTTAGAQGYCIDIFRCGSLGAVSELSSDCPASRGNFYQCCLLSDLSQLRTSPPIQPTGEICTFSEEAEKDIGKIIVTIGDK